MPISQNPPYPIKRPKPIAMNSFNGAESPATRARGGAPSNALNKTPASCSAFTFESNSPALWASRITFAISFTDRALL